MKATGIVRRIDELGRVVIPKEIRRTLKIRQGDPLEIFTDRDGEVILKKYSPIGELGSFAQEYAEALYKALGHLWLICDRDNVVAVAGPGKKEWADKSVSAQMEQQMQQRTMFAAKPGGEAALVSVVQGDDVAAYTAQVIVPIISEGESAGAVVVLSREKDAQLTDAERKSAQVAAGFLGRQMEQS